MTSTLRLGRRAALVFLAAALPFAAHAQAGTRANPLDTVRAGRFDNGKMWTFEYPPVDYFKQAYNFSPDTTWFRRARLGALRIPGCSASLVSPNGLVLTNHHCGRDAATEVKKPGESILDNGFYAATQSAERKAASMYADQLVDIVDVTAEVDSAARGAPNADAAAQARDAAGEKITERLKQSHGGKNIEVEVISLWNGAKTSAYVFHRYHDVRLVLTPELKIGYFGGDPDNFTYPRYAVDFTFFRIYGDDGKPLATPEYFKWSTAGVPTGDPVFVVGNPGSTTRLQTVAQLEYRRDVQDAAVLHLLASRDRVYEEYLKSHPSAPDEIRNTLFEFLNSEKAYTGIVAGLRDPYVMARRAADERDFRAALRAKPELDARYGTLFGKMEAVQKEKSQYEKQINAFIGMTNAQLNASALRRGIGAAQYLAAKGGGAPPATLDNIRKAILAVPQQPVDLQEALAAARFRDIAAAYGAASADAQDILGGRSPEVAAATITKSALVDSARAARLFAGDSIPNDDPAIVIARAILQRLGTYQRPLQGLNQDEEDIGRELGRARFDVYGLAIPPDATFSLRIADGVVKPYEYNGTMAPPHTTFYGMFDRYYSNNGGEWDLPKRWLDKKNVISLSTPLDFVLTADIIGGNSGSPVLDKDLHVVGLIFDGNIESLSGDYIYMERTTRAVAVDVRAILEALRSVYGATRIVTELTGAPAPAPVRR